MANKRKCIPPNWKECSLGEAATLQRGFDLPTANRRPGNVPIISSSGFLDTHDTAMVSGPGVVTGRYGTIGEIFWVDEDFWPLNTSLFVNNFHGNEPLFIYYMLQRQNLKKFSDKTGVPGINRNDVHKIRVLIPPICEQKIIVKILATWDEAIVLTKRLIKTKKCLKKFLTSNLLFGRKRFVSVEEHQFREHSCFSFPNDWKLTRLTKVFKERHETSSDLKNYDLASLTIEDGLIAKPERYNRDFLLKNKESNQYRIVYPGDFVYNPMNLRWGAIDCSKLSKPVLVSAYYNVLIPNNSIAPSNLLLALLTTSQMIHVYNNVGIGSLIEKKRVHLSDFLKLEIPLPSISESIKIDSTLKTVDQEIFNLMRYKDLLFKQKQGLMQKLLTGELRIAVQEAA